MSKIDENFIYKTAYEVIVDALDWVVDSEDSKKYPSFVSGVSEMANALIETINAKENNMEGN